MGSESRTALITGASSGLGAAIALEMATRGWKLAIGARRTDRLAEMAEKARGQGAAQVHAGELDVTDDVSVERFFAVLNPPQVGILAVGSIDERAVVAGGEVVVRPQMELTLSCDHRAVDGATASEFLRTLRALLEEPALAL